MDFIKTKVALIIPSTSKNRSWPSPNDSLLYKTMQSFKESTNDNFEYKFFIGYDYDDSFYNNRDNITFYENQGIPIEFIQLNVEKGHVTKMWNILAMRAYNDGFDYLYACGDDIIFNNMGWMDECIDLLLKNNNIGLTGPHTTNGNLKILTQCFVHRTHIDIFNFFYPEEITNWYCDDWINDLYREGMTFKLPLDKYTCSNLGGSERYSIVHCSDLSTKLSEEHKKVLHDYKQKLSNGTNHITILCDYNYLHYATALLLSMNDYNATNIVVHFLCLDQITYQVVSNLQLNIKIICYKDDVVLCDPIVSNLKNTETRYYFWSLASYFSNYIMTKVLTPTCKSVMYIDSDIFFHRDFHILYDVYQAKDIGIFKHRFDDQKQLSASGQFNVGIVYFKNSIKGRKILNWWTDAVIHKKYSNLRLHTCGDQKYLDAFPRMCAPKEIYIDENIGHGAPWNWASYSHIDANAYEIIYKDTLQPLVFTHFSKFKFDLDNSTYRFEFYEIFTDNNNIYKSPHLKKIHDEYLNKLKECDKLIQCKRENSIKIAVGMIVFDGDYVLKQCLDQIYPYVDQILITEGPVRFWQNQGKHTSTDNTNTIIDNYNDYANKIKVIHGQFEEKTEECNSYIPYIRNDIDYLWQIDSDELYTNENILKIKKMLMNEKPTSVGVQSCTFYGGFDYHLTGFEQNNDNFLRIFKYTPGCFWQTHRPPTIQYPIDIPKKHISSDELFNRWGIQMHHYSYVFPVQVKNKINYYTNSLNTTGIISNYYNEVYLLWIANVNAERKKELENKYNGVHEYKPERRGPCFTAWNQFGHPESIISDLDILKNRFNAEKIQELYIDEWKNPGVPEKQLKFNLHELENKSNYPSHWKNLLNSLPFIDSIQTKIFHDIACGAGSTYKLLADNQFNMKYNGSDSSEAMINTAKNTWNVDYFKVQDVFKLSEFGKNDIVYVDGLLDILSNSDECLRHILRLKPEYVILNRIHFSETNKISVYRAYEINIIDYAFEENIFVQIIKDNNYEIVCRTTNSFLLKYN